MPPCTRSAAWNGGESSRRAPPVPLLEEDRAVGVEILQRPRSLRRERDRAHLLVRVGPSERAPSAQPNWEGGSVPSSLVNRISATSEGTDPANTARSVRRSTNRAKAGYPRARSRLASGRSARRPRRVDPRRRCMRSLSANAPMNRTLQSCPSTEPESSNGFASHSPDRRGAVDDLAVRPDGHGLAVDARRALDEEQIEVERHARRQRHDRSRDRRRMDRPLLRNSTAAACLVMAPKIGSVAAHSITGGGHRRESRPGASPRPARTGRSPVRAAVRGASPRRPG